MLNTNTRNLAIVGAVIAVCALGAVGWTRGRDRLAGNPYPEAVISSQPTSQGYAYQSSPQPVTQPIYESDGYYPTRMRPIYVRENRQNQAQVAQPAPRRVIQEQEYYTDSRGRRQGRTKTHSVEVVAGTAAVGAVIGALAGGGQGAAIGAASGAGAGFVYDRLTHKH